MEAPDIARQCCGSAPTIRAPRRDAHDFVVVWRRRDTRSGSCYSCPAAPAPATRSCAISAWCAVSSLRSRSIVGNIGASIQSLFVGNITLYTSAVERARADAYDLMIQHAQEMGANAILAMRYYANEIAAGITEVLAYGTRWWRRRR